jgi:hypothetical protein
MTFYNITTHKDEDATKAKSQAKMQAVIVSSGTMVHVRRKKKRQRELKRAVKSIKSHEKGKQRVACAGVLINTVILFVSLSCSLSSCF